MEYLLGNNLFKYLSLKKFYNFTEKDMSEAIHFLLRFIIFS